MEKQQKEEKQSRDLQLLTLCTHSGRDVRLFSVYHMQAVNLTAIQLISTESSITLRKTAIHRFTPEVFHAITIIQLHFSALRNTLLIPSFLPLSQKIRGVYITHYALPNTLLILHSMLPSLA